MLRRLFCVAPPKTTHEDQWLEATARVMETEVGFSSVHDVYICIIITIIIIITTTSMNSMNRMVVKMNPKTARVGVG